MIKKMSFLFLVFVLCLSVCACNERSSLTNNDSNNTETPVKEVHPIEGRWECFWAEENLGGYPDALNSITYEFYADGTVKRYAQTEEEYVNDQKWFEINLLMYDEGLSLEPFSRDTANKWVDFYNNLVETRLADRIMQKYNVSLDTWVQEKKDQWKSYNFKDKTFYWLAEGDTVTIAVSREALNDLTEADDEVKNTFKAEFDGETCYLISYDGSGSEFVMMLKRIK